MFLLELISNYIQYGMTYYYYLLLLLCICYYNTHWSPRQVVSQP